MPLEKVAARVSHKSSPQTSRKVQNISYQNSARKRSKFSAKTKRGDTIIEVLLALAIFAMVAITSVLIMNSGIAASERSLELVTARNELNAQAEALRFIHSSYIAEMTLPDCSTADAGDQCQQFKGLWGEIIGGARTSASDTGSSTRYSIPSEISSCKEVYENNRGTNLLVENNAFVINTRLLQSGDLTNAYVRASSSNNIFVEPTLGARLIYTINERYSDSNNSTINMTDNSQMLSQYRYLAKAEGIWVVAVQAPSQEYYDFYINTCWYGSGASAPTTLDAVVRLYNPSES